MPPPPKKKNEKCLKQCLINFLAISGNSKHLLFFHETFFWGWESYYFFLVWSLCKISDPYNNTLWVNSYSRRKKKEKRKVGAYLSLLRR
jgi:hypothetical protein